MLADAEVKIASPVVSRASKSPAPSKVSRVFVDGYKSAEPPTSHGIFFARAFRTLEEDSRVASPIASTGKEAGLCPKPSGSWWCCIRFNRPVRSGNCLLNSIAKHYRRSIDVLVTDVIMRQLRGLELARRLTEIHPAICVIFRSGYSEDALMENRLFTRETWR